MPRAMKIVAWVIATILVAVLVVGLAGYASLVCLEYDPCPTGGWMPYGQVAAVGALLIGIGWVWLLAMVWRRSRAMNHPTQ